MIDINLIRQNPDNVKRGLEAKGFEPSLVDKVIEADQVRKNLIQEIETLRAERNKAAESKDINKGKELKEKLQQLEPRAEEAERFYKDNLNRIPNLPADDVPPGHGESDNKVLRQVGDIPKMDFTAKDHVELGKQLDIIDFEAGAKVAGNGFYYLKNEGAMLEIALVNYGMQFLSKQGYVPVITPDLARDKFYLGTGYLPKGG